MPRARRKTSGILTSEDKISYHRSGSYITLLSQLVSFITVFSILEVIRHALNNTWDYQNESKNEIN
jgi:hypothetical protein